MQIFNDKLFIKPLRIIQAFDKKSFVKAFSLIEHYKKNNFYLVGYIKYEAYNYFLDIDNNFKSINPILYFEVYKNYKKYQNEFYLKQNQKIQILTSEDIEKKKYIENIDKIKANVDWLLVDYGVEIQLMFLLNIILFFPPGPFSIV